ncbi:cytochrome P450 [Solihabitans fulvus]|uniref:Cytochrome P450 n=1 Tax=Solihabitans fulvus TaxID=1892852 RepID=A0A5B2XF22_9PSEU|nr:cytochrome P450 [Solihabitans fulvus]KAA2261510.1 cytochrome P450 [Solihabitans fulvus]
MTVPAADPAWQFDHLDPTLAPVFHETLSRTRTACPVTHTDRHGGYWAVLDHATVQEVAFDTGVFTSVDGDVIPTPGRDLVLIPIELDPPHQAGYRRILQRHFTRPAIARYEPVLRELTAKRLTALAAEGGGDLVPAIGQYLPPVALAEILGLPHEDGPKYIRWTNDIFLTMAAGDEAGRRRVVDAFSAQLSVEIDRQLVAGTDTVLTSIVRGEVDGRALTADERISMLILLMLGGHETTVHGISSMLHLMATVEGLRERLIAQPDLIGPMIQEVLRLESPAVSIARTASRDTELAGHRLSAGERVLMVLGSANRDGEVFERPDEFVCPRDRNPHVAFGYGVHRCVGEPLALLEMRLVAEEVLRIMPDYRLADGFEPTWLESQLVRGMASLPVVVD